VAAGLVALIAGVPASARPAEPASSPAAVRRKPIEQTTFATAEAAADALFAAAKAGKTRALVRILGPGSRRLVTSGDPVADENVRRRFVSAYAEKHELVEGEDGMVIQTGKDDWPFPVPLVDTDKGWRFDTAAGVEEVLDRRIGANELSTIQTSLAYVDAQREYHARNPEGDAPPAYAQRVASGAGKQDGLYWPTKKGEPPSPLGELFADARAEGYAPGEGKRAPYHGYLYRILKAQGPNAPGGAYDYMVRGRMIGGFALVAYPAAYGRSGVMTFVVNHDGVVYEKDLGPETAKIAGEMTLFDPDESWSKVEGSALEIPTAPAS
jgi:hypothetical protein